MTYQESLDFLFNALPMFQRVGAAAFKKDLTNTYRLCERLNNPQTKFKSIHIAGTNGKGSTAHALAAVLQEEGYKTGLYTSPHLKSFRERIKINGVEIPEAEVVDFVESHQSFLLDLRPSFFEMTVAMAFSYFAEQEVEFAVIEVGMGGRFDSTNVILPELSIITNIGLDHEQFLGNTLKQIAFEKAGIIKPNTTVIIGKTHPETAPVFIEKAQQSNAPIYFADQEVEVAFRGTAGDHLAVPMSEYEIKIGKQRTETIHLDLMGSYQAGNLPAIVKAHEVLNKLGIGIKWSSLLTGLTKIVSSTGLKGRWQVLQKNPLIICDTGHNADGIQAIVHQLKHLSYRCLTMVIGMVQDKDIDKILALMPTDAYYLFCQPDLPRALSAEVILAKALSYGLKGEAIPNVNLALTQAKNKSGKDDLIFIGGSTFVVAEINGL